MQVHLCCIGDVNVLVLENPAEEVTMRWEFCDLTEHRLFHTLYVGSLQGGGRGIGVSWSCRRSICTLYFLDVKGVDALWVSAENEHLDSVYRHRGIGRILVELRVGNLEWDPLLRGDCLDIFHIILIEFTSRLQVQHKQLCTSCASSTTVARHYIYGMVLHDHSRSWVPGLFQWHHPKALVLHYVITFASQGGLLVAGKTTEGTYEALLDKSKGSVVSGLIQVLHFSHFEAVVNAKAPGIEFEFLGCTSVG